MKGRLIKKTQITFPNDNSLLFNRKKRVTTWNHTGEAKTNTIYKTTPQTIAQKKQYIRKVWQKKKMEKRKLSREYFKGILVLIETIFFLICFINTLHFIESK